MVGVPRSKGCRLCVQRRVRCDQTRPTCNNCSKGNRPCPGYGQELKFQDEGARLRKRFQSSDSPFVFEDENQNLDGTYLTPASSSNTALTNNRESSTSAEAPYTARENSSLSLAGEDDNHWDIVGLEMKKTSRRTFLGLLEGKTAAYAELADTLPDIRSIDFDQPLQSRDSVDMFMFANFGRTTSSHFYEHINSPDLMQQQLVTKFKQSLFPDNGTVPQVFQNHARWLSFLPPLTGTNPLLDASVRAVTLVHIGRLNNSEPFIMESRPYYGQALKLLNGALRDRDSGTSNETLCAVILLSFYEMFASDNNDSWIRHAGGVSALMKSRGPQRHRNGFDREIFLAYRYTLIIEAFQQDVPCFLADPAWLKLSARIHKDIKVGGIANARVEIFDLAEEYYASMVKLPELCSYARSLWQARQSDTPPPHNRAEVIDKLTQGRAHFKATFVRFETALKKLGAAPTIIISHKDPILGIEYEFINTFVSATYTGYWTVTSVLNLCLQGLQAGDQEMVDLYKVESQNCGLNICRSSAYMLTSSFLGPFFLIFGLRVALLVFEDTERQETNWIMRKLFEIGDKHMGIAKHVPGYRAGITVDELIYEYELRRAKAKQSQSMSEKMEFARKVAYGDSPAYNGIEKDVFGPRDEIGGTRSFRQKESDQTQVWEAVNHVDDVLQAWESQTHFQLQETMGSLNMDTFEDPSQEASPQPIQNLDSSSEQRFAQAAVAFAMPDMNFFEQSFPNISEFGPDSIGTPTLTPSLNNFHDSQTPDYHNPFEAIGRPSPPARKNTLPRGIERFFT